MTDEAARTPAFQVNSGLMITGAVLAGLGSLLGLTGLTISVAAVAAAARRWARQQPAPPSELAKQQWAKARAATAAGAHAWRNGLGQPVSR